MWSERRTSERTPLSVSVTYRVNQQERVEAYRVQTVNVSEDGIFLKTNLPLGIGTKVELEFKLPGHDETLRFYGEVVWSGTANSKEEKKMSGKGIKFTECDDRCRRQLTDYITKESPEGE